MRAGAPRAALPILERLVTNFPAVARFRLELARALYLIEDDARARYHFEYAMSGELSLGEIKAVQDYLQAMETRKNWHGQARIAIVPQTNPWQRSGQAFVDIGGWPIPLPPVERAVGVELALGATWLPRLRQDLHARAQVVATGQMFEDSRFARGHLRGEFGFVHFGDHGRQFGLGVTVQGAVGREDGLIMKGAGVYGAFQRRFGRKTQISVSANFDELRYVGTPQLDGTRASISLRMRHILSPRLKVSGAIALTHHHTQEAFNRRTDAVISAGTEYSFGGGLVTGLEARLGHTRFAAPNPLLARHGPQRDWNAQLSATVMHRDYSLHGFAPRLQMGLQTYKSNVPMRSYNNIKVSLGATRNF